MSHESRDAIVVGSHVAPDSALKRKCSRSIHVGLMRHNGGIIFIRNCGWASSDDPLRFVNNSEQTGRCISNGATEIWIILPWLWTFPNRAEVNHRTMWGTIREVYFTWAAHVHGTRVRHANGHPKWNSRLASLTPGMICGHIKGHISAFATERMREALAREVHLLRFTGWKRQD